MNPESIKNNETPWLKHKGAKNGGYFIVTILCMYTIIIAAIKRSEVSVSILLVFLSITNVTPMKLLDSGYMIE